MEGRPCNRLLRLGVVMLATGLLSCTPTVPPEDLPTPQSTLSEAGRRLSRTYSADALTALSERGDRVLSALDRGERDRLARGQLRFRVGRPTIVYVAAPRGFEPFWLKD